MDGNQRMTVTLHWHNEEGAQAYQMHCNDQTPQQLIPLLVEQVDLPALDAQGERIVYELRLGGEQRPALQPRELISAQHVRFGSDLWLVPRAIDQENPRPRCILQLPDGTEIVVPHCGQELRRAWLLNYVQLRNPEVYHREIALMAQRQSVYNYVANRSPHCAVQVAERGYWIVTTDRTDIWTEYATRQEFDRVPAGAPVRLDNGMRLRLGGHQGLEINVMLI